MNKKTKADILNALGLVFLFWGISAISFSIYNQNNSQILNMCYFSLLIIGAGILFKKSSMIMSQIYILAIPLLIWNIDFLHWLIFQHPLFGITDYFFIGGYSLIGKIISLQHIFTIPLAIYAMKQIKIKRKDAWKWSFIQLTIIYFPVKLFSNPDMNINCVFNPCINISFGLPYELVWFSIAFSMTFVSSIIINFILSENKKINANFPPLSRH
jgi:hypothetical protein